MNFIYKNILYKFYIIRTLLKVKLEYKLNFLLSKDAYINKIAVV